MDSLNEIAIVRTNNHLVIMDKEMLDIIDRSEQHGMNQIISHHYKGIQFIALPSGEIYINLKDLKNKPNLIK